MIGPDPSKFSGLSPRVDQQLGHRRRHAYHAPHTYHHRRRRIIVIFFTPSASLSGDLNIHLQLLWQRVWQTSRCSDTSSPISSMSGLLHR